MGGDDLGRHIFGGFHISLCHSQQQSDYYWVEILRVIVRPYTGALGLPRAGQCLASCDQSVLGISG